MASDISLGAEPTTPVAAVQEFSVPALGGSSVFWSLKRAADIGLAIMMMPLVLTFALALLVLNPFFNRGPLMFRQERMGRDLVPFTTIKFRTMSPVKTITRKANDPVETHRITPLGRVLRGTRIDEFPQFINIIKGEMSMIGPRPDFVEHAREFLAVIPEYRARHNVRPGLSGLAQVTLGYVEGVEETRFKAQADLSYIRNAGFLLDLRILMLTAVTIVAVRGK